MIVFKTAIPFATLGVPFGIIEALLAQAVDDNLLKARYGILMLILAAVMLQRQSGIAPDASEMDVETEERRRIVDRDGTTYEYPLPRQGIEGAKGNPFQTGNRSGTSSNVCPGWAYRNNAPIA